MEHTNNNARMCAYKILYKIEKDDAFSNIALKEGLGTSVLNAADRRLVTTIVYGCVKYRRYLDYVISRFSSVKIKKLSTNVLLILRMGIYQIIKLDRVPDSAAVNESVKLASKLAYRSKGFINALLRKVSAEKSRIDLPVDLCERLGVEYSYPDELVKMWLDDYGEAFCEELMRASNESAPLTVRVNTLKTDEDALIKRLCDDGIRAKKTNIKNMLILDGNDIASLDSYREGLFTPQGIGSYLACMALGVSCGDVAVDLCAAPGGKSTHMAELMNNSGIIHSFDIHEHRTALIENSAGRLGIDIIKAQVADSSVCMNKHIQSADAVLADVPCSGLGIIRKKPDIKWSFDKDELEELARLQYAILCTGAKYVKVGATLVYSTCTISKTENMGVVERFLKENDNFTLCSIDDIVPKEYKKPSAKQGYVEFYPNIDGIDGFFICKMKRKC